MKSAAARLPTPDLGPVAPRVGYLIYRVERRLRARLDEAVNAHGVTTTEYVALSIVRDRDGLSSAQLARWAFALGIGAFVLRLIAACFGHHNYELTFLRCDGLAGGGTMA